MTATQTEVFHTATSRNGVEYVINRITSTHSGNGWFQITRNGEVLDTGSFLPFITEDITEGKYDESGERDESGKVDDAPPEPEWLTSLRKDGRTTATELIARMHTERGVLTVEKLSDPFVGLAASYLHQADETIAKRDAELTDADAVREILLDVVDEAQARITALTARVDELLVPLGDQEAKLRAMRSDMIDEAVDGKLRLAQASSIAERHLFPRLFEATAEAREVSHAVGTHPTVVALEQWLGADRLADPETARLVGILREATAVRDDGYELCGVCGTRFPPGSDALMTVHDCVPYPTAQEQEQLLGSSPVMREVPGRRICKVTPGPVGGAPETREYFDVIPLAEVEMPLRDGDVIEGRWSMRAPRPGKPGLPLAHAGWIVEGTVTRPVAPLPDKPGSVGTATVRGVKGVRVMRADDLVSPNLPWLTAGQVAGRVRHADSDLSDYQPLLDQTHH